VKKNKMGDYMVWGLRRRGLGRGGGREGGGCGKKGVGGRGESRGRVGEGK